MVHRGRGEEGKTCVPSLCRLSPSSLERLLLLEPGFLIHMASALKAGDLLHNRYRIRERIGQGGAGSIYLAIGDPADASLLLFLGIFEAWTVIAPTVAVALLIFVSYFAPAGGPRFSEREADHWHARCRSAS